ncbi:MAG: HD domain-containing protein [Deltaproteobacteria bacterium]
MKPDPSRLRKLLDERERDRLSPFATRSDEAIREQPEAALETGHRQWFSVDADRILHSRAYTRYIDKTQVFSLVPNDHITHRVLHVQIVSKVSRTIGRILGLNEDLIEAIALGHDIGHPPFGHDGERYLSCICRAHGLSHFVHSVQGVHFLRTVEKKGKGWNLSLQVLDGILCHDGETHLRSLSPLRGKTFAQLDREMREKASDPKIQLVPTTLEACVVRMSDVISYVGRDIEDAIRLNLIQRSEIPKECRTVLGDTNGTIMYRLVEDLLQSSLGRDEIAFSEEVAEALQKLKAFNMERIYQNPLIKTESAKIERLYGILFEQFLEDLTVGREESVIFREYLEGMSCAYMDKHAPGEIVRDFIAGMTDAYFLRMANSILIPQPYPPRFS